jgi:hypothetical protein
VGQSPPGRRDPRSRRTTGPGPDQWLQLPRWRAPLDTLLVLAVAFSAAWLGLVVIPAAANSGQTPVAEQADDTVRDPSPPAADETTDPSQWIAGPVYTGAPAAPTTEPAVGADVVAAPAAETRAPAARVAPKRTPSRTVPRSTARRPSTPTVAHAVVAATTTPTKTTPAPTSEASPTLTTTSEPPATSTPETSSPVTSTSEVPPTSASETSPSPVG